MARSYWDPANLLQITLDQNDTEGEIQCIGLARSHGNKRCRWTVGYPNSTKIRSSLVGLSKTKPELITTENLRRLAALCLCLSYHSGQVGEVVARWSRVVKMAVQHHKNRMESEESFPVIVEPNTQFAVRDGQRKIASLQKNLDAEKASVAQFVSTTNELRTEISSWKKRHEKILEESFDLVSTIAARGFDNRSLKKKLEEEKSAAAQFAASTAENINHLGAKVSSLEEELRHNKDERVTQAVTLMNLRNTNEDLEERMKKMLTDGKEIGSVRKKLEQASSQLQECRAEKDMQDVTVVELELSKITLEDTIKMQLTHQKSAKQENDSLQRQLKEANAQLEALQAENDQARNEIQTLEKEIHKIRGEQTSSTENLERLQLESNESKKITQRLTAELEVKDRSLHQDRADLEREQSRVVELKETISNLKKLQVDVNQSKEMDQKSRDEKSRADMEAKDHTLRQCQTELEHTKVRVDELEKKVMDLEISESSLKESISACWLHGFCTWLTRLGKLSVSKRTEDVELNEV